MRSMLRLYIIIKCRKENKYTLDEINRMHDQSAQTPPMASTRQWNSHSSHPCSAIPVDNQREVQPNESPVIKSTSNK